MARKTLRDAKSLGLLPSEKPVKSKVSELQAKRVIEFAQKNQCVINPAGSTYYLTNFNKFNCCPCAPERKNCPCEEAAGEILTLGKCKCQLFWRDYETYLVEKFKE